MNRRDIYLTFALVAIRWGNEGEKMKRLNKVIGMLNNWLVDAIVV